MQNQCLLLKLLFVYGLYTLVRYSLYVGAVGPHTQSYGLCGPLRRRTRG